MSKSVMRMRMSLFSLCAMVVSTIAPGAVLAGPVNGVVKVQVREGATASTTVVYAEPLDAPGPRKPSTFTLTQKGKAFVPRMLVVPVGSTIQFPNHDAIFHNVFSLSTPTPFDLGLYRAGDSKSRTFDQPATYRVFCNIHPRMAAIISVVPTPYIAMPDAGGAFTLDLPPGRYRLTALSEHAAPVSQELKVGAAAMKAPDLTLDESGFVQTQHKNKMGKEYAKDAYNKS